MYVSTWHGASGLQLGPCSGAVVAQVLQGRHGLAAGTDLAPYSHERFA